MSGVPVIEEFFVADISQRVFEHLGDDTERHRCNVCAHARCVDNVDRTANASHQYLGVEIVVLENLDQFPYELHPDVTNIVQAPHERTYERGPGLCSDYCLWRREDQSNVNVDALPG